MKRRLRIISSRYFQADLDVRHTSEINESLRFMQIREKHNETDPNNLLPSYTGCFRTLGINTST